MDVARISSRNLGRDDRVVADHGKEGRYPFLDEDVMGYLSAIPVEAKMDMTLPRGEGEKRLLRRLAAEELGLSECASLPKRAIQFGSRIAKMSSGRAKGADAAF
jgi:asparagine synthetase B (glutamine-hydrolysing)